MLDQAWWQPAGKALCASVPSLLVQVQGWNLVGIKVCQDLRRVQKFFGARCGTFGTLAQPLPLGLCFLLWTVGPTGEERELDGM